LLQDCATTEQRTTVLRLAAIGRQPLRTILGARRIDPRAHEAIAGALGDSNPALSAQALLDEPFRPRTNTPTPFRVGRFGDGTLGVYYAALEQRTCERELGFHLHSRVADAYAAGFRAPRRYALVACEYRAVTAELRGQEGAHPELVSPSEAGYAFCQRLAHQAVSAGIGGFFTRSARAPDGTCVPVSARDALGRARVRDRVTAHAGPQGVDFRAAAA